MGLRTFRRKKKLCLDRNCACLDCTLGKLPVPGSSSRPSISCAWGQDGCLAGGSSCLGEAPIQTSPRDKVQRTCLRQLLMNKVQRKSRPVDSDTR